MAPRSLVEMAIDVTTKNITSVPSLQNLPPPMVSKLLKAVKHASHLRQLEVDGDLYDETPEHWMRLIRNDYPSLERLHKWAPSNPRHWYKVYLKYKTTNDEAIAAATEKLKQSFSAMEKKKEQSKAPILSVSEAKRIPEYTTTTKPSFSYAAPHRQHGFYSAAPRQPSFSAAAPRPRPPKSAMAKISSQVRKQVHVRQVAAKSQLVPRTRLTRAPETMVRDKRIESQPEIVPTQIRVPRPTSTQDREREQREARLLRIKTANSDRNFIDFDDDDDDDAGQGSSSDPLEAPASSPPRKSQNRASMAAKSNKNEPAKSGSTGPLEDLFGDLEAAAVSSPAKIRDRSQSSASPDTTKADNSSEAQPAQRRRGLLSATPGSNKVTRVASSPQKAKPEVAAPSPPSKPAVPVSLALAEKIVTSTSPSPLACKKRKAPVDIFMRSTKKVRH
ncbi:hypothetical protein QBC47DRAFT_382278 [Echria macrotheca]|uniref:Elongin-A n=1 Tax=Echria macrotheca TaxID=438768 RepID=A0AAJ0BBH0_9PEZI|nr:hypothetical protein QBC47DRAFT_382278 [Echria macrotheca]